MNLGQKGSAAALAPVVLRILKAMDGRGLAVVEVLKGPDLLVAHVINFPRHLLHERPDLLMKRGEKVTHVNPVRGPAQLNRTGLQIARHRKSHRRNNPWIQLAAALAEIFQSQIAAQAEANKRNPGIPG